MILFKKTEEEVLAWDDIQFAFYVNQSMRFGRWLWNFFPPEIGGKDENERAASKIEIDEATPQLLLPSDEKFEDVRSISESRGLTGPQ